MKWFNKEMGDMKNLLSEILKVVGTKDPPPSAPQSSADIVPRPLGPSIPEAGPSGPSVHEAGPSGAETATSKQPAEEVGPSEHLVVEPPGPVISKAGQQDVEESAVAPEAPESSSLATPAPSSPPSSSTAPPAPPTFKQPLPRTISSPTPFPS